MSEKFRKSVVRERVPGLLFTVSNPSKLQLAANSLLALCDSHYSQADESVLTTDEIPESDNVNISDAIEQELSQLNASKRNFKYLGELTRGIGLLSFPRKTTPSDFVFTLLSGDLPSVPPMFVSRIIPIDWVCAPNQVSFESVIVPLVKAKFASFTDDITWKLELDRHGLTNITKESAIECLHSVIDPRHEVSIFNPDVVVMIQVTTQTCGVSLLRGFDKLCNYNLRKLILERRAEDA